MKIKLPIFFMNNQTKQLAELDIPYKFEDCDVRDIIFYEITAIGPFEEDGQQYTDIWAGDYFFTCAMPCHLVEEQLDLAMDDELNGENVTKIMIDYEKGKRVDTQNLT